MHIIVLPQFRATTYSALVFMGQNTYSARWASSLATPPKAEEKNKNAIRFQSEKISMSERTPKLHSSNIHTHIRVWKLQPRRICNCCVGMSQAISER